MPTNLFTNVLIHLQYQNHGFPPNGIFPSHVQPANYVPTTSKRYQDYTSGNGESMLSMCCFSWDRGFYPGKGGLVNSNYMPGEYAPARGMSQDGRFVQLQGNLISIGSNFNIYNYGH